LQPGLAQLLSSREHAAHCNVVLVVPSSASMRGLVLPFACMHTLLVSCLWQPLLSAAVLPAPQGLPQRTAAAHRHGGGGSHRQQRRAGTSLLQQWRVPAGSESAASEEVCSQLQQAILVQPQAACRSSSYPDSSTGCTCTMHLPKSIRQKPDTLYNPYYTKIPYREHMPTFPPLKLPELAQSPFQPYSPPETAPECPFSSRCKADEGAQGGIEECVGFNSWGFQEVSMSEYTPAAAYLNEVVCDYVLAPNGTFRIPRKVQAFWDAQHRASD